MATRRNLIDRDLGLRRFLRELETARNVEVVIGIQEGSTNSATNATIAEYGMANEFGTQNIPERSFMRTAFDETRPKIVQQIDRQYGRVQAGEITMRTALGLIGEYHQRDIVRKIDTNIPPPNAPETIARKGSSHTLIDTGAMRSSIRYIMRPRT